MQMLDVLAAGFIFAVSICTDLPISTMFRSWIVYSLNDVGER